MTYFFISSQRYCAPTSCGTVAHGWVPVKWEAKRNTTKRNKICKLRNETKPFNERNLKKTKSFLDVRIHLSYCICSSISKKLYFVIKDVFYTYVIYFIWQNSCTFPNKNKHCPIPYKCIINQFNFIMIDGHIKILIWHCKLT